MTEMDLNTKILHTLMEMGYGEEIDHHHLTVIKQGNGSFNIWMDGISWAYEDINEAADFIENNCSDDWPVVEPRDVISSFIVTITQAPNSSAPTEESVVKAVRDGLVRWGTTNIENVKAITSYKSEDN